MESAHNLWASAVSVDLDPDAEPSGPNAPSVDRALEAMRRLSAAGDFSAAVATGWAALRHAPWHSVLLAQLGLTEHRRGNTQVGVVLLRRAVKADLTNAALWNDLGNLLYATGSMEEAEAAYRTAIKLNPACAEAYNNLAVLLSKRGEHQDARPLLERALALRPAYADALYNMGNALAGLGKFQKALKRYEQAAAIAPEHPGTHFNLGITRLLLGDLPGGWPEWEWRWRSTLAPFKRDFPQPAWKGERLDAPGVNKRLLLYAEQGIGDTLQFLRYLPLVVERGATVVLEVQPPLVRLLARVRDQFPQVEAVIARGDALPHFDLHCSLMSLGAVFRTTLTTIPEGRLPWFTAPIRKTRAQGPLRLGLVWAGNPTHERDRERSILLTSLQPLFHLPTLPVNAIRWFSLQKGQTAAQLAESRAEFPAEIVDLGHDFSDFADTAAALENLDLVITVDTSVAHLAGAMGKPLWILLPAIPDWRWLLKRRDSPWYPTARLFRQDTPGDWAGVITEVARALQQTLSSRSQAAC